MANFSRNMWSDFITVNEDNLILRANLFYSRCQYSIDVANTGGASNQHKCNTD